MTDYNGIKKKMQRELEQSKHIIGVAAGSGLMTKCAVNGGADMVLLLTSSIFREMGRSSLAGYLPFGNSNHMVMGLGREEILPQAGQVPVIFGLCANDPMIRLEAYIEEIKGCGFMGVNNYPSVGLIDGEFRKSIEAAGLGYQNEVEAIRIAHQKGLFTVAFVFDEHQAALMIDAGADVICVQLGLTKGGEVGAKDPLALEQGIELSNGIFAVCGDQVIKMVYGGPVSTPLDLQYVYSRTTAQGYIGGSSFGRIPAEEFFTNRTIAFKEIGSYHAGAELAEIRKVQGHSGNYIDQAKSYIAENYGHEFTFSEMAAALHLSRSYLSMLFKKEIGCTFPEYLGRYRVARAAELIENEDIALNQISEMAGFSDYSYFGKTFKKVMGLPPNAYAKEFRAKK